MVDKKTVRKKRRLEGKKAKKRKEKKKSLGNPLHTLLLLIQDRSRSVRVHASSTRVGHLSKTEIAFEYRKNWRN